MKTVLYDRHQALGARLIDFCGWEMPVSYKGIVQEHNAVRQAAGLFDVSHMGRILVQGQRAEAFLDFISTNKIKGKQDGSATYTVLCNAQGFCVDDVIIYRENKDSFFLVVNASNRDKDLAHLKNEGSFFNVTIQDRFSEDGILALQGPLAEKILSRFFPVAAQLKPMHFISVDDDGTPLILSRTGYTGAGGFEIYAPNRIIARWWDALLEAGRDDGIVPVGLGARDTLRLEMGYALYGHEISETIAPIESVAEWAVKLDKEDFLGKQALIKLDESGDKRREYGIILTEPGVAREGYEIFQDGRRIGTVTSGTFSPSLQQPIAIILVNTPLSEDEIVQVQIRQNQCKAKVVKLPFIRGNK